MSALILPIPSPAVRSIGTGVALIGRAGGSPPDPGAPDGSYLTPDSGSYYTSPDGTAYYQQP